MYALVPDHKLQVLADAEADARRLKQGKQPSAPRWILLILLTGIILVAALSYRYYAGVSEENGKLALADCLTENRWTLFGNFLTLNDSAYPEGNWTRKQIEAFGNESFPKLKIVQCYASQPPYWVEKLCVDYGARSIGLPFWVHSVWNGTNQSYSYEIYPGAQSLGMLRELSKCT